MAGCCGHEPPVAAGQARVLWAVLAINLVMFGVEFTAGWLAASTALLGDSLDMLGDSLVYGFSLLVLARAPRWKAVSAAVKGAIMAAFGAFVLAEAVSRAIAGTLPSITAMATVAAAALAANTVCLFLLTRHREDDVNMRSAWLCSRNDLVANTAVLGGAAGVCVSGTRWPDLVVGVAIAALFLRSAFTVLADARRTYRADAPVQASQP